jgi:hypothetical protein
VGRAVVNSVWLWGGGAPGAVKSPPRIAVLYANAWQPRELAKATGVTYAHVPESLDTLRDRSSQSPALVWLDASAKADTQQRANWLTVVDRDWTAPARAAFHHGTIDSLEIVVTGRAKAVRYAGQRLSLARRLRSWRVTPRLSALLAPHLDAEDR